MKINLEEFVKNNKQQVKLISGYLDSFKDVGDQWDTITSLMEQGVALPGKYVTKVYDATTGARLLNSKDYSDVAKIFEKAGYKEMANSLYALANEELIKNKRNNKNAKINFKIL